MWRAWYFATGYILVAVSAKIMSLIVWHNILGEVMFVLEDK